MIIYQSDQSAKNYHGHGVHSDNRHHDYANESITLFGQTNRKKHVKWVNFRQLVVQTEKKDGKHYALRNEGGKYWLVMQG